MRPTTLFSNFHLPHSGVLKESAWVSFSCIPKRGKAHVSLVGRPNSSGTGHVGCSRLDWLAWSLWSCTKATRGSALAQLWLSSACTPEQELGQLHTLRQALVTAATRGSNREADFDAPGAGDWIKQAPEVLAGSINKLDALCAIRVSFGVEVAGSTAHLWLPVAGCRAPRALL